MKKYIRNCLATTGLSLLLLSCVATMYGGHALFLSTVFQTGALNAVLHAGLLFLHRFESKYYILEITLEMIYVILLVITFGYFCSWFSSTPAWVLAVMSVIVYFISAFTGILRMNNDIAIINQQLKNRKIE